MRWPARIEVLQRRPTVVLDAAHNVASVEALVAVLDESFAARRRIAVLATTGDKDLSGMLAVLLGKFDEVIFTRYQNNPRGVPPEELWQLAESFAGSRAAKLRVATDSESAWQMAASTTTAEDLICITGSVFIAAEMRGVIERASG